METNIELKNLVDMLTEQGLDNAEAQSVALMNLELIDRMKGGMASFTFRKADGTLREAVGTLKEEVVSQHASGTSNRPANPSLTVYWDNGAEAWRSFRKANLVSINP